MPNPQHSTRPMVSVVIPTLNREAILCETIEFLLTREDYVPFELIVIDQSDSHEESTTRYLESVSSRVVYKRATYKSLPRARNEGLALASGEIVVFVDDDVEPCKGFLAGHVAPYADEKVWVVTGPSPSPGEELKSRDKISEGEYGRLFADDKIFLHVDFDFSPCSWAVGCNLSVRKSAAALVGGFDERFVGNAIGEDAEFCHRIKKHGGTIYYAARAALVHFQAPIGGCRTDVGAAYVRTFAYNQNYYYMAIDGSWWAICKANWRTYRKFVLNRANLPRTLSLHAPFLAGAYFGWRQSRVRKPDPRT